MGFPFKLFYHFKICNMQKGKSQHLEFHTYMNRIINISQYFIK